MHVVWSHGRTGLADHSASLACLIAVHLHMTAFASIMVSTCCVGVVLLLCRQGPQGLARSAGRTHATVITLPRHEAMTELFCSTCMCMPTAAKTHQEGAPGKHAAVQHLTWRPYMHSPERGGDWYNMPCGAVLQLYVWQVRRRSAPLLLPKRSYVFMAACQEQHTRVAKHRMLLACLVCAVRQHAHMTPGVHSLKGEDMPVKPTCCSFLHSPAHPASTLQCFLQPNHTCCTDNKPQMHA